MLKDGLLEHELRGVKLKKCSLDKNNMVYKRHITKKEKEAILDEEEERELNIMKH